MSALGTATERPAPILPAHRWAALVFIAVAQLMMALDATVISIALPHAQAALGATDADRQWVVTAYTLAFGSLLLLGGRVADAIGRKRAFLIGLAGFALASLAGGAAPTFSVLVGARAAQGAFAALLGPTALSLLATTFTEPRERATAFAVYGSIAGSGGALGMILGGALTQYVSWRWALFINPPIAAFAGAGAILALPRPGPRSRLQLDLLGVMLSAGGLVAIVYGFTEAVTAGWSAARVVAALAAGAALLLGFIANEGRARTPLLPLRILADRNRGGAYLTVALAIAGLFGAYLFLTYYLQAVLHYGPLQAGLAFLPITIASQAGSWLIARRLMPRVPPRLLMAPGALVAAVALAMLTQLRVDSGYATLVLPVEVLLGLGISTAMVPSFSLATYHVEPRQAGVASAVVNAAQQMGASLGTALLNTAAASAAIGFAGSRAAAEVHGFASAAAVGAVILLLAAAAAGLLVTAQPSRRSGVRL